MKFIQYYDYDLFGKLAPVCGDRGVIILDGRNKLTTWHADAQAFSGFRRPLYPAYQIWSGEAFTRACPITTILKIKRED